MMLAKAGSPPQTRVPPSTRLALLEGRRQQLISLLVLVTAVALFVAPWVVGSPATAKDAHTNEVIVGVILIFLALPRFRWYPGKRSDLTILAAGAWLIASPWVLGLQDTAVFDGAQIFDVAAGIVLVVLAALSLLMLFSARRLQTGQK